MTDAAARTHIARFNAAVRSGDWSAFLTSFHPDAVMTFAGPPRGPFVGRDAIAAAYAANPPDDTMTVVAAASDGAGREIVAFAWSRGGTGTLTIRRRGARIIELVVSLA